MAEGAVDFDRDAYTSLLGLAEHFRTSQPPQLRECIHCLQACLSIGLPPILDAKIRLSLAKLLLQHTNNVGHARSHLQQAVSSPSSNIYRSVNESIFYFRTSVVNVIFICLLPYPSQA